MPGEVVKFGLIWLPLLLCFDVAAAQGQTWHLIYNDESPLLQKLRRYGGLAATGGSDTPARHSCVSVA